MCGRCLLIRKGRTRLEPPRTHAYTHTHTHTRACTCALCGKQVGAKFNVQAVVCKCISWGPSLSADVSNIKVEGVTEVNNSTDHQITFADHPSGSQTLALWNSTQTIIFQGTGCRPCSRSFLNTCYPHILKPLYTCKPPHTRTHTHMLAGCPWCHHPQFTELATRQSG